MPSFSLGRGTLLGVGYIRVEADTAAAETKLAGLGKGLALGASGFLALAAAGAATVDMASHFNTEMLKVQTQAGGSAADVKYLSNAILNMKGAQFGPDKLAEAMYHLKSVGLDNVTAMKDLKVAQDLAAVGGSDLEATTNALAGAWRSGIKGAQDMGMAAASVNAIIGAGNMKMQDFVAAIGTGILPSAKTFGLSLNQVGGALALMTDEGIPAVDAATRLRMSFSLLGAPSGAADKWLKKIGLTGLDLANAMRGPDGLIGAIQLLKDHLDASGLSASQQAQVLSRAFGGGRSNAAILTMLNNLSVLKMKTDQVDTSMGKLPAAIAAQQATLSAQVKILQVTLEQTGIKIGEVLIGPVTAFVTFLSSYAIPALGRFASALSKPLSSVGTAVSGLASSGFFQALMGTGAKTFSAKPGSALPPVPFAPGYKGPALPLSGAPLNVAAPRTGYFPSPVAIPLSAPAAAAKGPSALAQVGQTLHGVLENLATALGDTAKAAANLAQALGPFVEFMAKTGLGILSAFASILAHDVAPALVAVTGFLKQNSGIVRDLLVLYLTPLIAKMLVMNTIKSVTWFAQLARDVVMFPIQQIGAIKTGVLGVKDSISGFTAAGGGLDGIKLRLMYIGGALKTGATNALQFASNAGGLVKTLASSAWSTASGALQNVGQGLRMAAASALQFAKNMAAAIAEGAASAWSGIVSGASSVAGALSAAAASTWEFVTASAAATAGAIKQAAAFVIDKTVELASAVAEGIMTAAEWLLNIALMANPLILIIAGITLLVGAIIYIATKTTWFQTIWHTVWGAIMAVVTPVWNFLTHGLGQLVLLLAGPIGVLILLGTHWKEVWGAISTVALDTWHFLDNFVIHPIADAFSWLWNNGIAPMLRLLVNGFFITVDQVLHAAKDLVGWVPGVGGALDGVIKDFDHFRDSVNASLGGIQPKTVPVTISFNGVPQGQITGHTYTSTTGFSYARGGMIPMGAGTPGRDSVPILAMPGEFVVNTKAAQRHAGLLTKINAGQMKGYASGGFVGFDNAVSGDIALAGRTDISQQTKKIVSAYVQANNAYWANLTAGSGGGGGGALPSGSHLAIINAALAAAGVPPPGTLAQWQAGLNTLIGRESGWNPNAINLTDSNAMAGDPSRGLAQTIMTTFLAYVPGALASLGIYNPVANVAAAIRYIVSRYGGITNVQQANPNLPPLGYDRGGIAAGRGYMPKYTASPERVLSPQQTASFDRLVGVLDRPDFRRLGPYKPHGHPYPVPVPPPTPYPGTLPKPPAPPTPYPGTVHKPPPYHGTLPGAGIPKITTSRTHRKRRTSSGTGTSGDQDVLQITVNFNGPIGSQQQLQTWFIAMLTTLKRNNRLKGLVD